MDVAIELIRAAYTAGADVAKFQLYDAKSLFPTGEQGNKWYNYNCSTELSFDQVACLKDECDKIGIEFMASPFDPERVSWLEKLGVKRYKIASRSVRDSKLLNAVVATKKPIISSLGLWEGKDFPVIGGDRQTRFLYCVAKYPTPLSDINFAEITFSEQGYFGFSDHTVGISAPVAAISRGALLIEKHFTLDTAMYGPDHSCSMTPSELSRLTKFRDEIAVCLGSVDEEQSRQSERNVGESFVLQS
ncbi:N-acetylneuraminate synthase family protein [Owenweeksia hongkongensis]|uniref:N-acetylneuraminate synthase family protein n=1 Tax=Owenweeksia hongkongensis TaxID=253245 RepID=UPI003A8E365E